MGHSDTFKRYEYKYILKYEQYIRLRGLMAQYMAPDAHGETVIRNIYFDTPDYRLIRRSIEKPVYKEKLRIRSYRQAEPESTVFVELKKKYKKVVYKRRISLPEREAMQWICGDSHCRDTTQISDEIDYFIKYYEGIRPVAFISYQRQAYYGKDDIDFRITFDTDILCRTTDISLESEIYGEPLLGDGEVLLEIKCALGMPLWLVGYLSREQIRRTSFSKYGTAYQRMIYPKIKSRFSCLKADEKKELYYVN